MRLPVTALALMLPSAAAAHPGHDHLHAAEGAPFLLGLAHPIGGADHLLAMLAVGLWAATLGGRALAALPGAFLAAMAAGGAMGAAGLALPVIEPVILASVILLGAALMLALRPPLAVAIGAVLVFGLAHGAAHGLEGPGTALLAYGAGFVLTTAALLAAGMAAGLVLARAGRRTEPRLLGLGAMAAGLVLVLV
jgi:urease accessory protein